MAWVALGAGLIVGGIVGVLVVMVIVWDNIDD